MYHLQQHAAKQPLECLWGMNDPAWGSV
jgi:hypothetical protein